MYKVSILYPDQDGAHFDFDYYCRKHMPMVKEKLGSACTAIAVDKGIGGGEPGTPPPYLAIGYILADDLDALMAGVAEHGESFQADVPNYTNIVPLIQVNESLI